MFYSTVYPELKAIVFNIDKRKSTKRKKKKTGKETSPWVKLLKPRQRVWMVLGERSPVVRFVKRVSRPTGYLNVLSRARKHRSTIAT